MPIAEVPPPLTPPTPAQLAAWPAGTLCYVRMTGDRFALAKLKGTTGGVTHAWIMALSGPRWPSPSVMITAVDVAGLAGGWVQARLVIVGGRVTIPPQVPP